MGIASTRKVRTILLGLMAAVGLASATTMIVHTAAPTSDPATAVAAQITPTSDGWLPGG